MVFPRVRLDLNMFFFGEMYVKCSERAADEVGDVEDRYMFEPI